MLHMDNYCIFVFQNLCTNLLLIFLWLEKMFRSYNGINLLASIIILKIFKFKNAPPVSTTFFLDISHNDYRTTYIYSPLLILGVCIYHTRTVILRNSPSLPNHTKRYYRWRKFYIFSIFADITKIFTSNKSSNCLMSVMPSGWSMGRLVVLHRVVAICFLYRMTLLSLMCLKKHLVIDLCFITLNMVFFSGSLFFVIRFHSDRVTILQGLKNTYL